MMPPGRKAIFLSFWDSFPAECYRLAEMFDNERLGLDTVCTCQAFIPPQHVTMRNNPSWGTCVMYTLNFHIDLRLVHADLTSTKC
jgi:hypothetical protein